MHVLGNGRGRRDDRRRSRSGFTLVEVLISVVILTLSIGAISTSLATTRSLARANEERAQALDAVYSVVERMRATPPEEVFARFNATTLDDLGGDNPGNTFEVGGLDPQQGDADGIVGEVLFPGNGVELREDVNDVELGMPRDLNGDGEPPDNLDHATDYTILPVRVRAAWSGGGGRQDLDVVFVVSAR